MKVLTKNKEIIFDSIFNKIINTDNVNDLSNLFLSIYPNLDEDEYLKIATKVLETYPSTTLKVSFSKEKLNKGLEFNILSGYVSFVPVE